MVPAALVHWIAAVGFEGVCKFELGGSGGGTEYVRFGPTVVRTGALGLEERPDVVVKSDRTAIEAVLDGRANIRDLVTSERLTVSGDVSKIVVLMRAIEGRGTSGAL